MNRFFIYPWQAELWHRFLTLYRQHRLPNALLLDGAKGVGKYQFALSCALFLFCTNLSAEGEPCGQCRGCQLANVGNHPDYYHLSPEGKSHSITIHQVRALIEELSQCAHYDGYKVVVVAPVEALHREASNAILKTLEEPVGHTLFLLVTANRHQLLQTIRSRCQLLTFSIPDSCVAIEWLSAQGIESGHAARLLSMAGGAPLLARQLSESTVPTLYETLSQHLTQLLKNEIHAIDVSAYYEKLNIDRELFLFLWWRMVSTWIRDATKDNAIINVKYIQALFNFLTLLEETKEKLMRVKGLNYRLLLDHLFLTWRRFVSVEVRQ